MSNPSAFSIRAADMRNVSYADFIYLDTSFIVSVFNNERYSNECSNFMDKAAQAGSIFTTSGLVENELLHLLIKTTYEAEAINLNESTSGSNYTWRQLFEQDKSLMITVNNKLEQILQGMEDMNVLTLEYHSNEDFRNLVRAVSLHGLDSNDAEHVAIMLQNAHNSIATVDNHFLKVPNINIYGPSKDIVSFARRSNSLPVEFSEDIITQFMVDHQNSLQSLLVNK